MNEEFDLETPHLEFKRHDGSVMSIYRHKTDPHRFKAFVDGKPWDPTEMAMKSKK
jgi:hypothetical protein